MSACPICIERPAVVVILGNADWDTRMCRVCANACLRWRRARADKIEAGWKVGHVRDGGVVVSSFEWAARRARRFERRRAR